METQAQYCHRHPSPTRNVSKAPKIGTIPGPHGPPAMCCEAVRSREPEGDTALTSIHSPSRTSFEIPPPPSMSLTTAHVLIKKR